jgi:PST family polysaccharide transporter
MPTSVLYVLGRNWNVTSSHIIHIVLFAGGSLILVPRLGLLGYGLGEVVAMASYVVIHIQVSRLFSFSYADTLPWLLGFTPAFFTPFVPYPWFLILWFIALVTALLPKQRRQIMEYVEALRWRKNRTTGPQ